jgi:hypothetical protein
MPKAPMSMHTLKSLGQVTVGSGFTVMVVEQLALHPLPSV